MTSVMELTNLVGSHERFLRNAAGGNEEQPSPSGILEQGGDSCKCAYAAVVKSDEQRSPAFRLSFEVEGGLGLGAGGAGDGLGGFAKLIRGNLVKGGIRARKSARVAFIAAYDVVIH